MEKWEEIYRRYLTLPCHRLIFQQEGFVEGSDCDKSTLFYKYFQEQNVDYVGVGNRRTPKINKEILNTSFRSFVKKKNISVPEKYRVFIRNPDAEYQSVSKYDRHQPVVSDEEAWQMSLDWTIRHFGPNKMMGSRTVDFETAWTEINKQSSPSWPHNMLYVSKAKMKQDEKHMGIVNAYWEMIGRAQDKQEWVPVWQCSEKIELRPIEKIEENKVRTFTCSPIEHSIALNRMCLDMNNRFYEAHKSTWSFVGHNKFNSGFHNLHKRLKKHPNAFELDETAYDRSLFLRAMGDMVDFRYTMLSVDEQTIENYDRLENLYQSIIHSVIIMQNGEIFQKHTGNPSGSANTIVDNTVILFRLCAYAWLVLTKELNQAQQVTIGLANSGLGQQVSCEDYGYSGFMSNVEAALNGDDNTFTVSDKMVNVYNATTIATVWSSLGIITSTPNASFGQKVEDVNFLSQGFSMHKGRWLPTPETSKVFCSLMYASEYDDDRWHLLRACAQRIDSWANVEMRVIIQQYIEYLWEKNKVLFSQDCSILLGQTSIKMQDIVNMYKTDDWIYKLYTSYESDFEDSSLALMRQVLKSEEKYSNYTQ